MFDTGTLPLEAARWTPFKYSIVFEGINLTGATFAMEVRDRKDGGFVRVTLGTVTSENVEGVRFVGFSGGNSTVEIFIAEATMEAMDIAADASSPGSDGIAFWDLHITPSGGTKFVALEGTFTVKAGATNT